MQITEILSFKPIKPEYKVSDVFNRSFSSDVTAAILVYQNNEMAAILVYGTGISSFLFKYFVLFHHPTGATDHVSENDLYPDLARFKLDECYCSVHAREYIAVNKIFSTDFNLKRSL
jgi:hypothetical protein